MATNNNEWISPRQLAAELGISLSSLYGMNSQGVGPRRVKIGKHIRYRRVDVDAWLDQHVVDAPDAASKVTQ